MPSPAGPILVVEDHADVREAVVYLLAAAGYTALEAGTGQEALDILGAGARPCLILLDLMLPDMDGVTFHAALRHEHPKLADIPVAVVSARAEDARQHRQFAAAAYITKPYDPDELLDAIGAHCKRR
jgi:CheY-like chemotaxis protein